MRVVQISDIHYKPPLEKFEEMVEKTNRIDPDLIVFTGDFVSKKDRVDDLIACLGKITAKCPKFAILGNWEYWSKLDTGELRAKLDGIGITLLVNEARTVSVRGREVQVFGLDDLLGGKPSLKPFHALDTGVNLVLAHCPKLFDAVSGLESVPDPRKVLVLSGHTHGGGITLFGWAVHVPVGSGKYTYGTYEKNGFRMNVSRGVGNSAINYRLFAPSSIEVIEL